MAVGPTESGSATRPVPSRRPEYLGDPTLGQVMRRPQWIAALVLALIVAAVFAWLGQWQMEMAVRSEEEVTYDTETVQPLSKLSQIGSGVTDEAAGAVARVEGKFSADDLEIVDTRQQGDDVGAWVVARFETAAGETAEAGNLAVAIGWAPTTAQAQVAADRLAVDPSFVELQTLVGRYQPTEGAEVPDSDGDPHRLSTMVPAYFANIWEDLDEPVYSGYLILHDEGDAAAVIETSGLDAIDSRAPEPAERVSWLNVFYAIEWVVFAGFAVFFWFRLTRDAWEKEHELQELTAQAPQAWKDSETVE